MTDFSQLLALLSSLKLPGAVKVIESELHNAETHKTSYLSFLQSLLEAEVSYRKERKLNRNLTAAHFPSMKRLEDFEGKHLTGITRTDLANLLDMRWLDNHSNLLFFGPPGLGKTHLAISFGLKAVEAGYTVCFERMTNLVRLLRTMAIQRSATFRINRLKKCDLVIIDEIGYTPIERKEANLFFNLVSDLYEKSSLIITSNKGFDQWAEMLGDEIMTTALLDRLLHHAQMFSLNGMSYRMKTKKTKKKKEEK